MRRVSRRTARRSASMCEYSVSVSYTHLDVYKRQAQLPSNIIAAWPFMNAARCASPSMLLTSLLKAPVAARSYRLCRDNTNSSSVNLEPVLLRRLWYHSSPVHRFPSVDIMTDSAGHNGELPSSMGVMPAALSFSQASINPSHVVGNSVMPACSNNAEDVYKRQTHGCSTPATHCR